MRWNCTFLGVLLGVSPLFLIYRGLVSGRSLAIPYCRTLGRPVWLTPAASLLTLTQAQNEQVSYLLFLSQETVTMYS